MRVRNSGTCKGKINSGRELKVTRDVGRDARPWTRIRLDWTPEKEYDLFDKEIRDKIVDIVT